MIYSLVCGGACTGTKALQDLDMVTRSVAEEKRKYQLLTVDTRHLKKALQRVRYTQHTLVDRDHAECSWCGHVRRYGRTVDPVPRTH